jgi:uncharacterized membrane protein YeaQ/YmgE (transglycosylase-associated protein family)
MALILVGLIGSLLGWLATIIARIKTSRSIVRHIIAGMIGATLGGLLASNGTLLHGLSAPALLSAITGAVIVLALYNALLRGNFLN